MKVMVALARRLRRKKSKRRLIFRRNQKDDSPPEFCSLSQETDSLMLRSPIEKSEAMTNPAHHISIDFCHPPTYDECVKHQPALSKETYLPRFPVMDQKGISAYSVKEKGELVRGRTTQILYRSQLHHLEERKDIKRPFRVYHRGQHVLCDGIVDDLVALKVQRGVFSWLKHLATLQKALLIVMISLGFLSILEY